MQVSDLFRFKNREIKALHLTWIAFFICFYVWFNMAPLASSMLKTVGWLTKDDIRLFAIANVALTIPARIIVGMALDRFDITQPPDSAPRAKDLEGRYRAINPGRYIEDADALLDLVDREALQISQTRVAGAEIVERQ